MAYGAELKRWLGRQHRGTAAIRFASSELFDPNSLARIFWPLKSPLNRQKIAPGVPGLA